jgi:hypothetical protein
VPKIKSVGGAMAEEVTIEERMRQEERVREKYDDKENKWHKLYFGGGAHFENWLKQCIEIYGSNNIEVEVIDSAGFRCFEEGGEKLCRIWARAIDG